MRQSEYVKSICFVTIPRILVTLKFKEIFFPQPVPPPSITYTLVRGKFSFKGGGGKTLMLFLVTEGKSPNPLYKIS